MDTERKIELLAPAGNMECLEEALYFGADAVYLAGRQFGLRAYAQNFTTEEMSRAVGLAHSCHRKIYVTVNAILRSCELAPLREYLAVLHETGVDAVILSDPGAVTVAREIGLEIHLSTQLSTSNYLSASFWHGQGIKRIVLAREVSLAEIAEMRAHLPDSLELEAFIHGAMCVAYSGRCLLSSVLTGRSGNRGECAQPCRWRYTLHEAGYPEEYFPIEEDERGTYILNSKDLMMIEHIPQMVRAGICSFKIEGRMKSPYYVGCVVNAYRRAIDAYLAAPQDYTVPPELLEELQQSATRKFSTGFFFGNPHEEGQDIHKLISKRSMSVCAKVIMPPDAEGMITVEQRNKFARGERVHVLSPKLGLDVSFPVERIVNMEGEEQDSAPHPQQRVRIPCAYPLRAGDFLRLKKEREE